MQAKICYNGGSDDNMGNNMKLVLTAGEEKKSLKDYMPPGWSFNCVRPEYHSPEEKYFDVQSGKHKVSGKFFGIRYISKEIFCLPEDRLPDYYCRLEDLTWQDSMFILLQIGRAHIDPSRNSDNEDVRRYLSNYRYPQEPQRVLEMLMELYTFNHASVDYAVTLRKDLEQEGFNLTPGVSEPEVQHLLETIIDDRAIRYFGVLRGFDLLQSDLAHKIIDKVGLQQVWG